MKIPLLIATGIGLSMCLPGCEPNLDRDTDGSNTAYVPVYMSLTEKNAIARSNARTTDKPGKIYAYGSYIFQNDLNKGIHVIDNSDKANPKKIAFLNIPYNTEFAVKGGFIYANNLNDLVVIDIHDINNPKVSQRLEDAFPYINQKYPNSTGYFICPDPEKGIVVDWVVQSVKEPACRR